MTQRTLFRAAQYVGLYFVVSACSGADSTNAGSGGSASVGGGAPVGGVTSVGGTNSVGGVPATGGMAVVTGGAAATGGANSTGGAATGGNVPTGGNAAGGAQMTGGAPPATGGVVAGGNPSTGGAKATGGVAATGGKSAGGASNTGGAKSTGGVPGTGGSKATGGVTGTGGSAGTGVTKSPGCGLTTLPTQCTSKTTGSCSLTINGKNRTYYVVLPANYDPNTAYPVVTAWHWYAGTAEDLLPGGIAGNFYGIRPGMPNAIYTTAQGLDNSGGTTYVWNDTNGEDVAFAKAILTYLETNYCVDTSRIFATGFSYGGTMSGILGCKAPELFRALGIQAGSIFTPFSACTTHPIAAWMTHGTVDGTVPFTSGEALRDQFIKDSGCSTTNTQTVVLTNPAATCTVYNDCTAGNYPVVWCPVEGEDHAMPRFAAAEITKFFLQF